jgi:hypothetical protein
MTVQFRDTQFGHLVRLLSGNRVFCYPDEVDPSLCKKFINSNIERPQHNDLEAINATNNPERDIAQHSDGQDPDRDALRPEKALTGGQDAFLVSWYDQDDPEVCIVIVASSKSLTCSTESSKLVTKLETARGTSDLHSELCCVLCQFNLRTR